MKTNRSERRALEREAKKKGTKIMRVEDILRDKRESIGVALEIYSTSLVKVLRDDLGYGEKRIRRLLDSVNTTIDDISSGYVTLEELQDIIKEETNIDM